jgi:hypothetical protein
VHSEKSQFCTIFAIEKVEKNISLQRSRDLKTLFQNCFKMVSKEQSTRR